MPKIRRTQRIIEIGKWTGTWALLALAWDGFFFVWRVVFQVIEDARWIGKLTRVGEAFRGFICAYPWSWGVGMAAIGLVTAICSILAQRGVARVRPVDLVSIGAIVLVIAWFWSLACVFVALVWLY